MKKAQDTAVLEQRGWGGEGRKAWKRRVGTNASEETHHLVCQEQNCLETKFAGTEVEEIFQAGPQELHHHDIIVPLCSTPLNGGDTHWGKRKIKPMEQRKTAASPAEKIIRNTKSFPF